MFVFVGGHLVQALPFVHAFLLVKLIIIIIHVTQSIVRCNELAT